jgi:hypothetical protein
MSTHIVQLSKKSIAKKSRVFELLEVEELSEQTNMYSISRAPYINSEFVSPNIIPIIMQHFFASAKLLSSFNHCHGVYEMTIADLLNDCIKNWQYNRPPDPARCLDIARYYYNSKTPIDSMFYLSFSNLSECFYSYDGSHRISAFRIIKEENSKSLDFLCPGDFGSENDATWFYNQKVIVNVRFNASEGDIIEAFKNLNKSRVVPDLYIKDPKKEKIEIINRIANDWAVKHKRHFSTKEHPNTGNTNMSKFLNLLDVIYDKYNIDETTVDKLKKLLNDANINIMNNIPSKASVDMRLKCRETGCFLFLYKNDKLMNLI